VRSVWSVVRPLMRAVRHLPDRLLHPVRRTAALRRLRRGPTPRSILVLCYGNICRSPYAAERLRVLLGTPSGPTSVVSAGFHKFGRPPPDTALAVAAERGVAMSAHRSRLVDVGMLRDGDLVLVVDPTHATMLRRRFQRREGVLVLGDLDPQPIETRTIPDPLDQSDEVFGDVYGRIDRCLEPLARVLQEHASTTRPHLR
jgi:protein-tyrosine-phosphatase